MGSFNGDIRTQIIKDNCAILHEAEPEDIRIVTRGTTPRITGDVLKVVYRRCKEKRIPLFTEHGSSYEGVVAKLCDASSAAVEEHYMMHGYETPPRDKKDLRDCSDDEDSDDGDSSASDSEDSEHEGSVIVRARGKGKEKGKTPVPATVPAPPRRINHPNHPTNLAYPAQDLSRPAFSPPNGSQRILPYHQGPPGPHYPVPRPMNPPMSHGSMGKPPGIMSVAPPPPPPGQASFRGPAMPLFNGPSPSPSASGLARIRIDFASHGVHEIATTVAFHSPAIYCAARKHCESILGPARAASHGPSHLRVLLKAVSQGATRIVVQETLHDLTPLVRSLPATEGVPVFEVDVKNMQDD